MWEPLAAKLAKDHTVMVPDLRGMGLSARRPAATTRKPRPGHRRFARRAEYRPCRPGHPRYRQHGRLCLPPEHPDRITRFVIMDAPLPGVGPWDDIVAATRCGTSRFMGRTPSGWWTAASASISTVSGTSSPPTRSISTKRRAITMPRSTPAGAMHAGFEQFKAFDQDAIDNKAFVAAGKLTMPIWRSAAKNPSARWRQR